jgi:hypothetical protein
MAVIEDQARELELWYENSFYLHEIRGGAWIKSYRKKMERGRYNHELAVKGIAENYIPEVIQHYNEHIGKGQLGNVSKETKYAVAEGWVDSFEQYVKDGDYTTEQIDKTFKQWIDSGARKD